MGLAPYGVPKYKDLILKELMDLKEDGSFRLRMKYFNYATGLSINDKFSKLFGQKEEIPKRSAYTIPYGYSSVQSVTEEIILKLTSSIAKETNISNLCLAGGVALNCVANGKILKNKIFKEIWIQPAAGDAGGSLGAALAFWYKELKKNRKPSSNLDDMNGSYLGPSFSDEQIESTLKALGAKYEKFEEEKLLDEVSKELSNEKTAGWFQGRMEFRSTSFRGKINYCRPKI